MKFLKSLIVFLIINFGALGLGVLLMGTGASSEWYTSMNQAPWTPPNWVFGAAWTFIMFCFSIYMTFLYLKKNTLKLIVLFTIQFILNVAWNYVFFNQHFVGIGLAVITALTIIVTVFMITYLPLLKFKSLLILPYFIWICIATSLNLYMLVYN